MNTKEQVRFLETLFSRSVCQTVSILVDDVGIQLAGEWTIYDTEVIVPSIKGDLKVPGFALGRSVYIPSELYAPDDGDFIELTTERTFEQIAKAAVLAIVEARIDAELAFLDTEAQAKELFG